LKEANIIMANLALGIDTGGTFTDGVIFDLDSKKILKKTKTITTRHKLFTAIDNCLNNLITDENDIDLEEIRMVSLSTTLATNAIVEGQGAEVGLILIGFEPQEELPTPFCFSVGGTCNIKGKIKEKLDVDAVKKGIESIKDKVDAFAISGYLSVRNPVHELQVEKIARELTSYPVVSAHQLSSDLGFYERTVTAVFNARLMPLITDLIDAVEINLENRGINAPLMVVKGDGSLISAKKAREKPVETSLSGPAASIIGAMALTGVEDGIVVDMGGTTTDVAVLEKGRPHLTVKGAKVGGWLTRVKAAEIITEGLGGDSFIQVSKEGILSIGPQRVFPLAWIVSEYPYLYEELKNIKDRDYFPLNSQPTTVFVYIKEPYNFELSDTEKDILKIIKEKPHSLYFISKKLKKDTDIIPWHRLVASGSIHRASITPTDILHVTGDFKNWDINAARLGVEIMAKRYNTDLDTFIDEVLKEIYFKLASLIAEMLIREKDSKVSLKDKNSMFFLKEFICKQDNKAIEFSIRIKLPLIAVGAPVRSYFPQVADRLNAKLFLPESAEVANAVGTVSGKVIERVDIIVKPGEKGGYIVHSPEDRESFINLEDAIKYGREMGKDYVYRQANSSGASDIELMIEQKDKYSTYTSQVLGSNDEDRIFIETRIKISAVGKPWSY
jgi:N-methylhydantoinase A/oxoprolinase/acetone carboxylase beta subunit